MRNAILFVFILFLGSCNKEVDKESSQDSSTSNYFVEVTFDESHPFDKKVYLNGEELGTLSFNATSGDHIKVEAVNYCWWETSTQVCDPYTVRLHLDGSEVKVETCECEILTLEHTIE